MTIPAEAIRLNKSFEGFHRKLDDGRCAAYQTVLGHRNGNAQLDTGITPAFGTAALLCDGTGDYVEMSDHADLTLGSGNWTAECRFYRAGGDGGRRFMFGQSVTGSNSNVSITCQLNASNVVLAYVGDGTATITQITGTTAFTATG